MSFFIYLLCKSYESYICVIFPINRQYDYHACSLCMLYLYPPCMNICYVDTCPWKGDRLLREDAKGRCLAFPLLIVWLGSQWEMTTWFGFDLFPTSPKLEWLDGKVVRFPFKMEKLFHCSFNHSNLFLLFGFSPPSISSCLSFICLDEITSKPFYHSQVEN